MRIDDIHRINGAYRAMARWESVQPDKMAKAPRSSGGRDQIEISQAARQMSQAQDSGWAEHLEALRQQVQSGQYQVPGKLIAQRMLEMMRVMSE